MAAGGECAVAGFVSGLAAAVVQAWECSSRVVLACAFAGCIE